MASYWQLFQAFFKMGLFTIGGGMAMVPVLQDMAVNKYKWMTEEETLDCIAVSQSLPGVVAVNMATYVGAKTKGLRGSICCTIGVMLPSIIIITLIAMCLGQISDNVYVQGALMGIRAAAVGLIAWATWKMGRSVLRGAGWFAWAVAILGFVLVAICGLSAVWAIISGIVAGLIYSSLGGGQKPAKPEAADGEEAEK